MTQRGLSIFVVLACTFSGACSQFEQPGWSSDRPSTALRGPSGSPEAPDAAPAPTPDIFPSTRLSAGKMLEAEGNIQGAILQYRKAVEANPNDLEAFTRLGISYNRVHRYEEAAKAFLRAIELAPDKAYVYNNLGFCYVLQGRLADAENMFRLALDLQPDYQRARMNYGAVLAEMGRTDQAVAEFSRVVTLDLAYYNLGLILASGGQYVSAEIAFRRCLEHNPGSRDAAAQLARMSRRRGAADTAVVPYAPAFAAGRPSPSPTEDPDDAAPVATMIPPIAVPTEDDATDDAPEVYGPPPPE
jgi:Tfp pilus assembly protein PilF